MHATLRTLSISGLVLLAAACGEKGEGDPSEEGSGGSSSSGGSGGGESSGGAGGSSSGGSSSTGGSAGAPVQGTVVYGFDEGLDAWKFQYSETDAMDPDAEKLPSSDIDVVWGEEEGNPGGAMRAEIPYTTHSQYIGFGVSLTEGSFVDLTGKIVSADVKILSGVESEEDIMNAPPGAKLYAKSGSDYAYVAGTYRNVEVRGEWIHIDFDPAMPGYVDPNATFDPTDVREIGVQFDTNGMTTTAQPGVWLLDNVAY